MVVQVEAFKLLDELEELCFMIKHESEYDIIMSYLEEYKIANIRSCNNTILLMENAFLHSKTVGSDNDKPFPVEIRDYITHYFLL